MYLLVLPAGTKYWRLKYRFGGKEKSLSLGVYPDTSLAEARAQRAAMRAQLAAGTDPSRARRADLERERDLEAQRIARSRFEIDEDGALLIRLGVRHLFLTPGETAELRAFLTQPRHRKLRHAPDRYRHPKHEARRQADPPV